MKTPLVAGNWKLNGTRANALRLARGISNGMKNLHPVEVVLAPPFTALATVAGVTKRSKIRLAAQNVHWEESGAFTGEISPKMLKESGCQYVIIGHSERRHIFLESDLMVAKKILAALNTGLLPILCVGETLNERQNGKMRQVLSRQLRSALKGVGKNAIDKITIAYEPVWAIGTGHHATGDQVTQAHRWIRNCFNQLFGKNKVTENRILYGGSVRPENTVELAKVSEVNGLLVGGASLKAIDFLRIIRGFAEIKAGMV